MQELLKDYGIAGSNSKGFILESNEEKLQSIDEEWNYLGFEYLVYDKTKKSVVFKSHNYMECQKVLLSL